jgi:hypothetical protein
MSTPAWMEKLKKQNTRSTLSSSAKNSSGAIKPAVAAPAAAPAVAAKKNFFTVRPKEVPANWIKKADSTGQFDWVAPSTSPYAGWTTDDDDTQLWFVNPKNKSAVWDLPPVPGAAAVPATVPAKTTNINDGDYNIESLTIAERRARWTRKIASAKLKGNTQKANYYKSKLASLNAAQTSVTPAPAAIRPAEIPADWIQKKVTNKNTGKIQNDWIAPTEGAYKGWTAFLDDTGKPFFADAAGKTYWHLPGPLNQSISKIQQNLATAKSTLNKLNATLKKPIKGGRRRSTRRSTHRSSRLHRK